MENNNLVPNRFITDHSLIKFLLEINNQTYELSVRSTLTGGEMCFYTIFKPVDYDHIIYMSEFSTHWPTAKKLLKEIANQVSDNYNINIENYENLNSFISR